LPTETFFSAEYLRNGSLSVGRVSAVRILVEPSQLEISCRHVWKEISNYHDREISEELRQRIARHLNGCNHCRAIYDGLRNTVTLLADNRAFELPHELSAKLYTRLHAHLARKS